MDRMQADQPQEVVQQQQQQQQPMAYQHQRADRYNFDGQHEQQRQLEHHEEPRHEDQRDRRHLQRDEDQFVPSTNHRYQFRGSPVSNHLVLYGTFDKKY